MDQGATSVWGGLARSVQGQLVLPSDTMFDWSRKPFIARFDDSVPAAVLRCHSPQDVAAALAFTEREELPFAVRSGGHCFAGRSSTNGLLIDLAPLDGVRLEGETAVVGTGTTVGGLTKVLAPQGRLVPGGSCPTVGIGGTTLGGGLGVLGRMFGLTCDHLLQADVVLADGELRTVDADHDADLFWALRGAGGCNFAVATAFRFRTRPALRMTNFYLEWPYQHAAAVLDAWQRWAPFAPDEIAAGLGLTAPADPAQPTVVEFYGAAALDHLGTSLLIEDFLTTVDAAPQRHDVQELSYLDTARYQAGLLSAVNETVETPVGPVQRQAFRFTKSEFFDRFLPEEALVALVNSFVADDAPGQYRGLELAPWQGAYNRVPVEATAFAHRDQMFSLKHAVLIDPASTPEAKERAHAWVNRSWAAVHPWGSGAVYPNFPDPDLVDGPAAYHGVHLDRLGEIKAVYDPAGRFTSVHGIEPRPAKVSAGARA